jgi:hypothetical protein
MRILMTWNLYSYLNDTHRIKSPRGRGICTPPGAIDAVDVIPIADILFLTERKARMYCSPVNYISRLVFPKRRRAGY